MKERTSRKPSEKSRKPKTSLGQRKEIAERRRQPTVRPTRQGVIARTDSGPGIDLHYTKP